MRIAVFSDVHGNAEALDAVLEAIDALGPDEVFALGDHVGRGPDPRRVLERLDARGITCLRGNWEEWVARKDESTPKRKAWVEAARAMLARKELARLEDPPHTLALDLGGRRVVLAHGSPRAIAERLTGCTPVEDLREAIAGTAADVVAVGHSHHAFVKRVDGTLVVNCGSVGYPVVGDPRACFALIELAPGMPPSAELIRVPYAFDENRARMEKAEKRGKIGKGLARSYFRAMLGNGEEPREPLSTGDQGHTLLVKLLARPSRGVYRALSGAAPELGAVREAALDLGEALALAEGTAKKRPLARARRRLARLARAIDAAHRCTVLAERLPEAGVRCRRRRAKLDALAKRKRMIAHGLDVVALMMSSREGAPPFADVSRAHLARRARAVADRAAWIEDRTDTDGHARLLAAVERLAATAHLLGRTVEEVEAARTALTALAAENDAAAFRREDPVEPEWLAAKEAVHRAARSL